MEINIQPGHAVRLTNRMVRCLPNINKCLRLKAQLAIENKTRIAEPLQKHPLFNPDRLKQVSLGASLVP